MSLVNAFLAGGINKSNPADGGAECIATVSNSARATISILGLGLAALILWTTHPHSLYRNGREDKKRQEEEEEEDDRRQAVWDRTFVYRLTLGLIAFIGPGAQIVYKVWRGRLLFMLQPCHMVALCQSWLCFRRSQTGFLLMVHYGTSLACLPTCLPASLY